MHYQLPPNVTISAPQTLYKWAKVWGGVQKKYYRDKVFLRREKQILDFILLNQYHNVYVEKDTDVFDDLPTVDDPAQADLVLITDQKFSRMPCRGIVDRINSLLAQCPNLMLCLNKHYINIDNSFRDSSLSDNLNLAVTQWLIKQVQDASVLDLSLDYVDRGDWFTWVIPDRIYFIQNKKTCG